MTDELKRQAALRALNEIRDGMIVGLGTGSTASHFIRELGNAGLKVAGIPTSEESSRRDSSDVGIPATFNPALPSSRMKWDAVEPVPSPTIIPSRISLRARSAACLLNSSVIGTRRRAANRLLVQHAACIGNRRVVRDLVLSLKQPAFRLYLNRRFSRPAPPELFWIGGWQIGRAHV